MAGVEIKILQQSPLDGPLCCVEAQQTRRDFAHGLQRLNNFAIKSEMVTPQMAPGVKQWDRLTVTVQRRNIGTFVPVAKNTSIGEIARIRRATVLSAYDVINLMGKARTILVNPAVFAPITGPFGDCQALGCGDVMSHCPGFDGRAPWPCVLCAQAP